MHVAVAIVGYRNVEDIVRCLDGLARSTHADFEVVICENGGRKAFESLTARIPFSLAGGQGVRCLLASGNLGYAGGVNRCLEHSPTADAWWILNPDTWPDAAALAAMVDRLSQGDTEAVGCTLHLPDGRVQSYGGHWRAWLARAVSIGHGRDLAAAPDPAVIESRQNYLNGASMLVGRRFVETVGPMRSEYFLYCEEVEWCLRGLSLGMRLGFASGALVLHYQGTATGNAVKVREKARLPVFLMARNQLLVTREGYPARTPLAVASTLALVILRFAKRGAWRQLGYGLAGWWAGVRGERGAPAWAETSGSQPPSAALAQSHVARKPRLNVKRYFQILVSLLYWLGMKVSRAGRSVLGLPRPNDLVVLYYHTVHAVDRRAFARQLDVLDRIATVAPAEAHARPKRPADASRQAVAITFDDAFLSVADHALPELSRRGLPCTIFVPVEWLGRQPGWEIEGDCDRSEVVVDCDRLRSLPSSLVKIGAHSLSHPFLTRISRADARREISESRRALERLIGAEVRLFAFPYGDYDDEVVAICQEEGYEHVFSIRPQPANLDRNDFLRGRVSVRADDGPLEFMLKASGAYGWLTLASKLKHSFGLR